MQLKTFVKVGGINNLSDARYCAGMGVDMLGFCMDPNSSDYVNPESYKEITEWLEGPLNIGEFSKTDTTGINKAINENNFDGIQVEIGVNHEEINFSGVKILAIPYSDSLENIKSTISENPSFDYYLIDSTQKITLKEAAYDGLNEIAGMGKILLGVGITLDNIEQILYKTEIEGIHLKGSDEERPGWSNLDDLADLLESIEVEI